MHIHAPDDCSPCKYDYTPVNSMKQLVKQLKPLSTVSCFRNISGILQNVYQIKRVCPNQARHKRG